MPGSESKLLKGLEIGCDGIITATCNVTAELSRKVYDDFFSKKEQIHHVKLCNIRKAFDKFNLSPAVINPSFCIIVTKGVRLTASKNICCNRKFNF